ncbi:uncharacterized protein PRCAT00005944001 [Priceomyces carsonii]|uniref:uncharacterized protein n=1 Tax=Priceomyces carsonii TaxID=28549 RepID=UPI002EDAE943|nr:unnamed protein product [Priceomyces carsonii]
MASQVSPTLKTTPSSQLITLAAGCFWGVELFFRKRYRDNGIVDIKVGYANGISSFGKVNYQQVCSGTTNFAECVQISYEPSVLNLKELLQIFFRMHNPTTLNAQGPDVGTQYRSAIFTHSEEDNKIALQVKEEMQKTWYPNHQITTIIEPIRTFYDAEDYHQQYLKKNPSGYECPTHFLRTKPMA